MPSRPSAASRRSVPASVLFRTITASIVENLEQRFLLTTTNPTDAQLVDMIDHMSAAARQAVAIVEYNNPTFQAKLDADLAALGLDPIPPVPGTIPTDSGKSKHHRKPHKINLFHQKKPRHHRKDGPVPPTVTNVNYYYDQPLPNQLAITFNEDVTASNWDSAISVINLNTGTTLATSGTYSSALDTVEYNLNASAVLPDGNYAVLLHGSQITDTTHSLALTGSDSVSGHDFETSFFFMNADFNHDHQVSLTDFGILSSHYNHSIGISRSEEH